jgi:hypothetical protein
VHPHPFDIATAAEEHPDAADAAAAKDSGGSGSGGNISKKWARLFKLDMSTTTSDCILECQREREERI